MKDYIEDFPIHSISRGSLEHLFQIQEGFKWTDAQKLNDLDVQLIAETIRFIIDQLMLTNSEGEYIMEPLMKVAAHMAAEKRLMQVELPPLSESETEFMMQIKYGLEKRRQERLGKKD